MKEETSEIVERISKVISIIDEYRIEPNFTVSIKGRQQRDPNQWKSDSDVLQLIASLIAYSQNAKSGLVKTMLKDGTFSQVFEGFDVNKVAKIDKNMIINTYWIKKNECIDKTKWNKLTVIRNKGKIDSIIKCANALMTIQSEFGSFSDFLNHYNLPKNLISQVDIPNFWVIFQQLKSKIRDVEMPFVGQTTTLLHLLLDLGYPCVKPDIWVMRVSKELGLVDSETGNQNLIQAVQAIQQFSLQTGTKPAIVDLYFSIWGGQDELKRLVKPEFYDYKHSVHIYNSLSTPTMINQGLNQQMIASIESIKQLVNSLPDAQVKDLLKIESNRLSQLLRISTK